MPPASIARFIGIQPPQQGGEATGVAGGAAMTPAAMLPVDKPSGAGTGRRLLQGPQQFRSLYDVRAAACTLPSLVGQR